MKKIFVLVNKRGIVNKGMLYIIENHFDDIDVVECVKIQDVVDVVIQNSTDVIMMGINGLRIDKVASDLMFCRSMYPSAKIVVYASDKSLESPSRYFQLGVDGYLTEEAGTQEIITCIERTLLGKKYLSNDLLVDILMDKTVGYPSAEKEAKISKLSPRESQIASLFLSGNSTSAIARMLSRKPSTISTIKKNIFVKMQVSNIIQLSHVME